MAEVYFVGDCHFGHRNILQYRPEFQSVYHHNQTIVDNINAVATKRDKIFFMGDICFDETALEWIKKIDCPHKHLLMGNHDDYNLMRKFLDVFETISGDIKYKEFWLSHIPIHPAEMRGKSNIHAHMHRALLSDPRYFSVSLEQHDYKPVSLQQIRKEIHKNEQRSLRSKIVRALTPSKKASARRRK